MCMHGTYKYTHLYIRISMYVRITYIPHNVALTLHQCPTYKRSAIIKKQISDQFSLVIVYAEDHL